jgi:LAO/AO transport system kinase
VAVRDLEQMLRMGPELPWTPPVVPTTATEGAGIEALWSALVSHWEHLTTSGELERGRRERLLREVESLSLEKLRGRARALLADDGSLAADLTERRTDPYRTAAILEERITGGP